MARRNTMNFGRIAITLVSCLSFSILGVVEARKDKDITEPMKNNQEKITSEAKLNNCYLLIQKQQYEDAYDCFKNAIELNDSTLGGVVFEIIINGLTIFGYLDSSDIEADNYGIIETSIKKLLNISEDKMTSVFSAIYEIAHGESYSNMRVDECFQKVKEKRKKELAMEGLTEVLEPRKRKNEEGCVTKNSAKLLKIKKRKIETNTENPIPVVVE